LRQSITSLWRTLDRAGRAYHRQGSFSFDHIGQEVRELHQNGGGEAGNNQDTAAAAEPPPAEPEAPVKQKDVLAARSGLATIVWVL